MKKFSEFISEAKVSLAQFNAKRMGLVNNGHGDFYDPKTGEFVAKVKGDKLKFYNQNQKLGEKDPRQNRSLVTKLVPKSQQTNFEEISVVFGRFNPPTIGHQMLFDVLSEVAQDNEYRIYPSRSSDSKKNPLDPETKISVMREMYPEHRDKIVDDDNIRNILDVLKNLCEEGYKKVNIVVGADRQIEFDKLTNQYNNNLYNLDEINIISAGDRDPESDDIDGVSSSKLRKFVVEGNFQEFSKGIPEQFNQIQSYRLYKILRQSMNLDEGCEIWEIAPKYDVKNLRENYLSEKIYKIGQWVENLNTGLIGKVIRRGTNYLICVTEDNVMFKPWIRDVKESEVPSKNLKKLVKKAVERQDNDIDGFVDDSDKKVGPYGAFIPKTKNTPDNFTKEWTEVSGVPADQRLVGTDAFREYVMKLTDTKKIDNFSIKNFINKYKKK